jgi:hypothetical protein
MKNWRQRRIVTLFLIALLVLPACAAKSGLSGSFDPENQKEYGMNGTYVGQNIQEAIDILRPAKADFMDMQTREVYTVEQMASGQGKMVMGMMLVDRAQVIVMVEQGVIRSIMLAGVPEEQAEDYKTNRGLAMYDSEEQLKKLYGEAPGVGEVVYSGSKQMASFGIVNDQVVWFRFDSL